MRDAGQETDRKHGAKAGRWGQHPEGVHSPGVLGTPKQGQLLRGEVSIEEGKALQDAFHQALGRGMLWAGSLGL